MLEWVDLFYNLLSHSNNVITGSDEEPIPEQDSSLLGHFPGSGVFGSQFGYLRAIIEGV